MRNPSVCVKCLYVGAMHGYRSNDSVKELLQLAQHNYNSCEEIRKIEQEAQLPQRQHMMCM